MIKRKKAAKKQGPARKPIELSPHRITGVLTLPGLEIYPNQYESGIEREGLWLLTFCHDVHQIKSQPVEIDVSDQGWRRKSYTPDVSIQLGEVDVLIEFKALSRLVQPKTYADLQALGGYFRALRQSYFILTDDQFKLEPRRTSATLLRRYLTSPVSEERRADIELQLADGPQRIRSLMGLEYDPALLRDIYSLIARRHLCFDWHFPLSVESEVSLPGQPFGGLMFEDLINSGRFADLLQQVALGREPANQRLLAFARSQDWSIPDANEWGFVDVLPDGAYTGRYRYPGSLLSDAGHERTSKNDRIPGVNGGTDDEGVAP